MGRQPFRTTRPPGDEDVGVPNMEDLLLGHRSALKPPRLPSLKVGNARPVTPPPPRLEGGDGGGDVSTVPPPVPADEYVAQFMGEDAAPPATARYREPSPTLVEAEPLRFDHPTAAPAVSTGRGGRSGADFDFELSRATPVPASEAEDDATDAADTCETGVRRISRSFEPPSREAALEASLARGDYSAALVLAEALVAEEPSNERAQSYVTSCQRILAQEYQARLGSGQHRPRVVMGPAELHALALDHRAGFVLACIDGESSVEEILDVSGMPVLDALRTLFDLVQQGVIVLEPPVRSPRLRR
jgi:hypothetical protein